jgi:hypothetical protein
MSVGRRPRVLAVLAVVLSLVAASLAAPASQRTEAADPFTTVMTVFRLFQGMSRRAQTYEQLDAALVEEQANLDQQLAIAREQRRTRIITTADFNVEYARIHKMRESYVDITERLKKLTKRQTDRFIGDTLMNFAVKELSKTSGFIKVANDIDEVFDVANEGITALIDNVGMAAVDVIGQINELQRVLDASSGFLSLIGGRAANDLSRTLANASQLLGEGVSLAEGVRAEILAELQQALAQVEELQAGYQGVLERVDSWGVGELRIDLTKFNDPVTVGMWSEINRQEGSRNGQAVLNGWATRFTERVSAAAGTTPLSAQDVQAVASMAAQSILSILRDQGRRPEVWEIDLAVWQALNMWLVMTGRDPLDSVVYEGEWHAAAACDENEPGWTHRWAVDLTQDDSGVVKGTIRYHDCPDGGRVAYSVTGVATRANSMRLMATMNEGYGDLGKGSPRLQVLWIVPNGMPSINLAP